MNKTELVGRVAESTGESLKKVDKIFSALVNVIKDEVQTGSSVQIPNFGVFSLRERAERQGNNPRTGETITIPACKVPYFKPSKNFKAAVN